MKKLRKTNLGRSLSQLILLCSLAPLVLPTEKIAFYRFRSKFYSIKQDIVNFAA